MKRTFSAHLFRIFVGGVFCCIISCKDDDDVPPSNGELKVTIDVSYIDKSNPTRKVWFMVSSINGKIIGLEEADNGSQVSFRYPNSVTDDNVYLSEISARTDNAKPYCYITTYLVPRISEFTFARPVAKEIIGTSKITITNFTPFISDYFLSRGGTRTTTSFTNNVSKLEMGHYKNPDDVFIYAIPSGETVPRYKWLNGVEINKEYTTDFTTFESMALSSAVAVPNNDLFSYTILGYTGAVDEQPMTVNFGIYTDKSTSFQPYLPASGFQDFATIAQYRVANETYEIRKRGPIPGNFTKPALGAVVTQNDISNFSIDTSGEYDYALIQFANEDMSFAWTVFHPSAGTINGKFPMLPATITKTFSVADITNLDLSEVRIADADELSGYNDFTQKAVGNYYFITGDYTMLTKRE
jgi:hypothetical protein